MDSWSPSKQWARPISLDEYQAEGRAFTERELEALKSTPEFLQLQQLKERRRNMVFRAYGNLAFSVICVFGAISMRTLLYDSEVEWRRQLWPALLFLSIVGVAHTILDLFDVYVLRPIQSAVVTEVREPRTLYLLWLVLVLSTIALTVSNLYLDAPTTSYLESWSSGLTEVLDFTRSTLATPLRLSGWSRTLSDAQLFISSHVALDTAFSVLVAIAGLCALFFGVRLWSRITFLFGFFFVFMVFFSLSGLGFSLGEALAAAVPSALATLIMVFLTAYALKSTYDAFGSFGWTKFDNHTGEFQFNFNPYLRGGVVSTVTLSATAAFWVAKFAGVDPAPLWLKYALHIGFGAVWGRFLGLVLTKSARILMIAVLGVGSAYLAAFASKQMTSFLCQSIDDLQPTWHFCEQEMPFLQMFTSQTELIQNYGALASYFPSLSGIVLTPVATLYSILLVLVLSGGAKTLRPIVTFVLGSYGFGWLMGLLSPISESSPFTLRLIFGATRYQAADLFAGLNFVLLFSIVTVLPLMLEPFFRIALTSSIGLGLLMFEQEAIGRLIPAFNYISWVGIFILGVYSQLAVLMLDYLGFNSDSDMDDDDAILNSDDAQ